MCFLRDDVWYWGAKEEYCWELWSFARGRFLEFCKCVRLLLLLLAWCSNSLVVSVFCVWLSRDLWRYLGTILDSLVNHRKIITIVFVPTWKYWNWLLREYMLDIQMQLSKAWNVILLWRNWSRYLECHSSMVHVRCSFRSSTTRPGFWIPWLGWFNIITTPVSKHVADCAEDIQWYLIQSCHSSIFYLTFYAQI